MFLSEGDLYGGRGGAKVNLCSPNNDNLCSYHPISGLKSVKICSDRKILKGCLIMRDIVCR